MTVSTIPGNSMGPQKINQKFNSNFYPDHPSDVNDYFLYDGVFLPEANFKL